MIKKKKSEVVNGFTVYESKHSSGQYGYALNTLK